MSPTTFRFVHASDLHLDVPFHGLRRAPPEVTRALCRAPLAAWDALVQLAIDHKAAFLLLAGDICDGAERAVWAQLGFLEGLQRLSDHGIRTFIVRGDRDPAERWMGIHQWPNGVHCFGSHNVESVAVTIAGEQVASIHGISHCSDYAMKHVVPHFVRRPESGIHVGLLHAWVESAGNAASGYPCSMDDLQTAGMDYWALGHAHRHELLSSRHPWIVHPGTLQGRSLNDDETGPKGAVVVNVTNGVVSDARFHPLDSVRLMTAEADVSTHAGAAATRRVLLESAMRFRREHPGRHFIVRAVLRGRHRTRADIHLRDLLIEELRQEDVGRDTLVWWDSVLDMTEAAVGREIGNQHDLSVHVRALVDMLRRAPASLDRFLANQGDQVGPLAGPGVLAGQPILDSIERDELLTRAERLALDVLEYGQT